MAERVLSVRLRAIVDGYEAAMGRAATATDKVAKAGKSMEDVGKKMTKGFTLPVVAAGGFALKSAVQFESAFAGVRKTVDGTASDMAMLERGIIDMANSMPSTREEIAGVAEAAGQLGISTDHILGFSRVMIDLGNSTDIVARDAAISLAQLANITKMPQSQFSNLGSAIVALGNNFATTESRIVDMSLRIASAGSQIGLSEAEILGFATALSSVGIEAEAGGSAISRAMIEVAKAVSAGGDELEKWSGVAGMTSDAFAQLFRRDAAAGMSAVIQGLGNVSASGRDVFGVMEELGLTDVRLGNAIRSLAGNSELLDRTLRTSSEAMEENSALTKEAGMRYATTESQLKIARNRITDVARQFGEVLVPAVHATLNIVEPLAHGMGGLVQAFSTLPAPVQVAAGSILALAAASGPAIWGLGKLAKLYGPLTSGAIAAAGNIRYLVQAIQGIAATRGVSTLAASLGVLKTSLLGLIGPQAAVVAAIASIAGVAFLAHRSSKQLAETYMSSAEAADILATSVGLLTRELRDNKDAAEDIEVLSDDDFRAANEAVIGMLRNLEDLEDQQTVLLSIAFDLEAAGNDPEDVVEHVTRLAETAGVEVPVELTVEGIGQFEHQINAATDAARRAMEDLDPAGDVPLTRRMKEELTRLSEIGAGMWQTDETAAWAQILGESLAITEGSAEATNHLVDEMLRLTDVQNLSTNNATDLASALDELTRTGENTSTASEAQKEMLNTIRAAAEGMEGGLTPANFALAASQYTAGISAKELGERINRQREATDDAAGATQDLGDGQDRATATAEQLADAIERAGARAALATIDFDAAAAAAQAFVDAVERSTNIDDRLGAGLRAGRALRDLHEGLTGEKRIAEIHKEAAREAKKHAEETEKAADAVDRLGDAARRADPKFSGLQFRLDTLAAAAEGFRQSLEASTSFDDEIAGALDLGDAFDQFEKTYRRLPHTLDLGAVAMGKLRPRTAEAVRNMLDLGKAAREYLASMIEMGRSDDDVRSEATRLRDEYARMFRQMGLNTDQVNRYLEAMGLLPEQINTAISVSGVDAARFQLNTYLQLLEGRIPDELATQVIADIETGNIDAAADRLAAWARTNPPRIDVEVGSKGVDEANDRLERTRERIEDVKASLWDLPDRFDPLKAALGEYSDAQMAALDAVQQFGDGVVEYLSRIAHDGNVDEVRSQAFEIRDAFLEHIGLGEDVGKAFDNMSERAQEYLTLIGLSDWQIESAITLSGDAEAMARINLYSQLLADKIPPEKVSDIIALIDEGKLQEAERELVEVSRDRNSTIRVGVEWVNRIDSIGNPFVDPSVSGRQSTWGRLLRGRASGGLVTGPGTETSDSIPTMLSNREFVLKASAVRALGVPTLEHMNRTGTVPADARFLSPPSFSDSRIVDRLARIESAVANASGGDHYEMNVVSPVAGLTPRRIAEAVGTQRFLGRR